MAVHRAVGVAVALHRLASVATAAFPRPSLLVAPVRSQAAAATAMLLNIPQSASAAAVYARRGYASRGGDAQNQGTVSEDEEEDEGEEDDEDQAVDCEEEVADERPDEAEDSDED